MSKNFELLHRITLDELFTPAGMPGPHRQAMPGPHQQATPSPAPTRRLANEEITKLVQRLFLHGGQAGGPRVCLLYTSGNDRPEPIVRLAPIGTDKI